MPQQIEVFKDGESTIIHDTELEEYVGRGYTPPEGYIPPQAPQEVPQDVPAGATAEDILGQDAYGDELAGAEAGYYETLTPEYREEQRAQSDADIMKRFQQEIDALEAERVSARGRIVSQYGQIGKERAGTSTAIQARRGLVGSTFGTQQKREVASQTQREQEAAMAYSMAQYSERKRAIMGDVRTAQADEAKLRLEAAQLGSQAKIEEIRGRKTRSDERVSAAIKNLLGMEADVEDEELMNEVAEGLGISVKDLMSKYQTSKDEAEEAQRILDEEQLDREMKRNLTQSQIDKIENDRKMIEKKFEQDVKEYGSDYAMKEKEFALDKWEAEQKATIDRYKAYKTSTKPDKIVEWSEEVEAAGVVGWTQEKLDWVMNSPTAPPEFNKLMEEERQMSKASWQKEWDEQRNPILDAYRGSEYTDVEMRKLRQAGLENASQKEKDDYLYGKDKDDWI